MKRCNRSLRVIIIFALIVSFHFSSVAHCTQQVFSKGETIIYDVKKFGIKVGEASLVFNGAVEVANRKALSITFTAQGFKFFDEEQIYLDPETFYPMLIKRKILIFGRNERIIEYYDIHKGKVRIVKTVKGKTTEQVIENGDRFENIYGFIYRQRKLGLFSKDEELKLHLPTLDVRFKLHKTKKFKIAKQEFMAHFFESVPKKYKVVFGSDFKRTPLRIDGALGGGNFSMIFREQRI